MLGILCEKPSAARNFAKALGGTKGNYNGTDYVIVAARGHLYEFDSPENMLKDPALASKYHSWDIENLPWDETDFNWKLKKKKDCNDVLKNIKTVLSACDEIAIATDIDPTGEGELLAWEILSELKLTPKTWSRFYFDDESEKSIKTAFTSRKVIPSMEQDMDYVKGRYRARWDFLSMQFTRIAKKCGDGKSTLRQGRLKSTMVQLVGDQLKKIAEYKKIPYYQNRFRDENGVVYINPDEPSFPTKDEVPKNYKPSPVVLDEKSIKHTAPPKLIDIAGLSAALAPKGFKPQTTLSVYQKMYDNQVVSYPRTEDKYITPEQFNDMLPLVDKIANVVGVDPSILTHRSPRKTHVKTGCAHGANRPGPKVPASLDELKQTYGDCAPYIYEILAKSFLAMLCEDYEYESQKGHLKNYPDFKGSANIPKKMGYKVIYNDVDEPDENENANGLGTMADPFIHEGFPPKPTTPTVKWMMKQLEKYNVGTGATRTSTLASVTSTKDAYPLLIEKKGKLSMSEFGEMSYHLLPGTNIGNIAITEKVMNDMKLIAEGKADPEELLKEVQQLVKEDIITMQENGKIMRKELNIMAEQFEKKEKVNGTNWEGHDVTFNRVYAGHRFSDEEVQELLEGKEITLTGLIGKTGKPYGCKGRLAQQTYNGHSYYGFQNTGFVNADGTARKDGVPSEWCGHKFTDDEIAMLQAGKRVMVDDCISKKSGNQFSCYVEYKKNERGHMGIVPDFS